MTSTAADVDAELDSDALFAALEAEADLDDPSLNPSYRAARLQQLSRELAQSKLQRDTATSSSSSDRYRTLSSDPEVLTFTTENSRAILHFFHSDFARCSVMDQHLEALADAHADVGGGATVFGRVDVKHATFVVEKLGVRVLPSVVAFVKGVAKERVTGFEGLALGGDEKGRSVTGRLEGLFVKAGILGERRLRAGGDESDDDDDEEEEEHKRSGFGRRGIQGRKHEAVDSDDDWD